MRGTEPGLVPKPYQPYPGDHPCEIAGCAANAPFGVAALPRRVWFCREHLEEITCLMATHQPTPFKFSEPSVGQKPTDGATGSLIGKTQPTTKSEEQLTLFNDGPSTTG